MSSSTMIHGVTTRGASATRTPADAATIAPSHNHGGSPATRGGPALTALSPTDPSRHGRCQTHARKRNTFPPPHDPRVDRGAGGRRRAVAPGFDGGLGDPPQHRAARRVTAGGELERGHVRVGDRVERVLSLDI